MDLRCIVTSTNTPIPAVSGLECSDLNPATGSPMSTQAATNSTPGSERAILQTVCGSRRSSNIMIAAMVSIGSIGFLLASASSYWHLNLLPADAPMELVFVPQGLVMGLYGTAGSLLALYLWLGIAVNFGSGENHFDLDRGELTVRRQGWRRCIEIRLPLKDVQAVKVDIRDGINPRRRLILKLRGRRDLPLSGVGQPVEVAELEASGARLASFLDVPLQGLS